MLRVGISARYLSRSPEECGVGGKSIQFVEQNVANLVARAGALPMLIPSIVIDGELSREHFNIACFARELDALVLQGGVDINPELYGELRSEQTSRGDLTRDLAEMALIQAFHDLKKPVLGICRGMQMLNVFFGGTLHQDIPSEIGSQTVHVCEENREFLKHSVEILPQTKLAQLYGARLHKVNSIHHQCIKKLGADLIVEAMCPSDNVIEAIRYNGEAYAMGVQWHPEHFSGDDTLDAFILFNDFLRAAQRRASEKAA